MNFRSYNTSNKEVIAKTKPRVGFKLIRSTKTFSVLMKERTTYDAN
jgi:hypothetical protein